MSVVFSPRIPGYPCPLFPFAHGLLRARLPSGEERSVNGTGPPGTSIIRGVFSFESQSADALPTSLGGHPGSFVDLQVLVKSVSSGNLSQENGAEVRPCSMPVSGGSRF